MNNNNNNNNDDSRMHTRKSMARIRECVANAVE